MALIYHLVAPETWEKALNKPEYESPSLKEEGFIHCSSYEQVLDSAKIHYASYQELIVLAIPEKKVKSILKWEPSRSGKLFPHLYGKIQFEQVETTHILSKNAEGMWEWE